MKEVKITKREADSLRAASDIIFNICDGAKHFKRFEKIAFDLKNIFDRTKQTNLTTKK